MKSKFGYGLAAFFATASLAVAGGGEGDKEKSRLSTLGNEPTGNRDVTVAAAAGEGVTISAGEAFSLNFRNGVQFDWSYSALDGPAADVNTFAMKRARTMLKGNVWSKDITYFTELQWEGASATFGGGGALLEAWADWAFWHGDNQDSIALRVGQQKVHHGREFDTHWSQLEHTNRSLASNVFSGNRVVGAMAHGTHLEGGKLHWSAGVGNNDPALASAALEGALLGGSGGLNPDNELNYFFSGRFDPWGNMDDSQADLDGAEEWRGSVGASLLVGNHRSPLGGGDVESTDININAAAKGQGFHALGEIFIRSDDQDGGAEADSTGWAIGGSYTLPPAEEGGSQWGFAVRYSMIDLDDAPVLLAGTPLGTAAGDVGEIEGTVTNYYHRHNLKTQVNYKHQTVDPNGGTSLDNDFIEVLFQWIF
jgi:hypothetical protein